MRQVRARVDTAPERCTDMPPMQERVVGQAGQKQARLRAGRRVSYERT